MDTVILPQIQQLNCVVLIVDTVHFSRVYLPNAATAPLTPGCLSSVYYISSTNYVLCCCVTFVMRRLKYSLRVRIFCVTSVRQVFMPSENCLFYFCVTWIFCYFREKGFMNNKLG
jgi:hypothetical protein